MIVCVCVHTHTNAAMCVIVVWSFVRPDGLCSLSASRPRHAKYESTESL